VFTELAGHHDLTAGAERAEMSGLLLDAMADSLPVAERLGVRVETSCPVPLHVVVNVPRVTQALSQLLNVALEYSSSQSTVLISCVPSNGHAVTTFSNDRGSIPEMELPRLFDAFFVSRFRPSAEDSSVWLALARKIVEASGGELRAENTPPDGFRLVIRLPLAVTKENGASQISAGAD
jgi:signal transduction histidine kinase